MSGPALTDSFVLKLPMTDRSVGAARRALPPVQNLWQLDEASVSDVLLVATELGTNAVRHARVPGRWWRLAAVRTTDHRAGSR